MSAEERLHDIDSMRAHSNPVKEEGDNESILVDVESHDDVPGMKLEAEDSFSSFATPLPVIVRTPPELAEWLRHFKSQVLTPIFRNTKSAAFRKPVDAVALGIYPVYFQIIKKPMDLGTVRQNIDTGVYETKEECINDLMRIWENAMTFNAPEHPIHEIAAELKELSQSRLERFEREGIPPQTPKPLPIITPKRESLVRRDARKKSFDLPGEISTPQHLEQKYVSKLSTSLRACDSILKNLMSLKLHRDYVEPFIQVERKAETDVYQPMSLLKIQHKLRNLHYNHPMEFADDIRRIVTETYRYCHPDDPLILAAAKLQQEFEMLFAKINFHENELVPAILTASDLREDDEYVTKLLSAQNFMVKIQTDLTELIKDYMRMKKRNKNKHKQEQFLAGVQVTPGVVRPQLGKLVERKPVQPPAKKPKFDSPPPSTSKTVLTLQQANELKDEISCLESKHQFKILEILQANGERLVPDSNGEVEIEIVSCSAKSVADVRAFIAKIKNQKKHPQPVVKPPQAVAKPKPGKKKVLPILPKASLQNGTSRLSDSSSSDDSSADSSSSDDSSDSSSDSEEN